MPASRGRTLCPREKLRFPGHHRLMCSVTLELGTVGIRGTEPYPSLSLRATGVVRVQAPVHLCGRRLPPGRQGAHAPRPAMLTQPGGSHPFRATRMLRLLSLQ